MALGSITFTLSALTSANSQVIRPDSATWTATFTNQYEVDIPTSTSPATLALNGVIGATPVCLYIYNNSSAALTFAVNAATITTVTIPAGQGQLFPQFVTTNNGTLTLASGTGTAYVLALK